MNNCTTSSSCIFNSSERKNFKAAILDALETTLEKFGAIDILVNNAGIYMYKSIEEYSLEEFDQIMNINVKAVFVASQFAARHMKNGSQIITIASNMADRLAAPGGSLYAMSKAALTGLTKGIARDLGSKNITVNLIQPGPVDTDMNPENSEIAPILKSYMGQGRYGTVEEIAGLVAYLSGDESQFITGASITMDGGFNISISVKASCEGIISKNRSFQCKSSATILTNLRCIKSSSSFAKIRPLQEAAV